MRCFLKKLLRQIGILDGVQVRLVHLVKLFLEHVVTLALYLILASGYLQYCCATCTYPSCSSCRSKAHLRLTCAQNKAKQNQSKEEALSAKYLALNSKECKQCGRFIEKISGCDHMTCDRQCGGCGAEWCWSCGAEYSLIRKLGNTAHSMKCPWYA
jgi:hypothetical protein